ncbi:MAG TPA: hypothetical protein VHZ30_02760 [Verrucomicrobiae bacterium]|nr:hypothetical protein [Verrucomicrobiae bacterium]
MPAHHETGEFIDSEFQSSHQTSYGASAGGAIASPSMPNRPPTREEIEAMVSEKQIKLAELKRAQEELERERATLEEMRRRQAEFHAGREEMLRHLTRGIGLLEEAELNARRDAEQMSRTLGEFREAVEKVQILNEQNWTPDTYNVELTRGLTTIENARMEWNSARLKFTILTAAPAAETDSVQGKPLSPFGTPMDLRQLCKVGLALTWPLVVLGGCIFLALLLRH